MKATEEHPPASYNLYGYTFDSGAVHYLIKYFANAIVLEASFKKNDEGIIAEDITNNIIDSKE